MKKKKRRKRIIKLFLFITIIIFIILGLFFVSKNFLTKTHLLETINYQNYGHITYYDIYGIHLNFKGNFQNKQRGKKTWNASICKYRQCKRWRLRSRRSSNVRYKSVRSPSGNKILSTVCRDSFRQTTFPTKKSRESLCKQHAETLQSKSGIKCSTKIK